VAILSPRRRRPGGPAPMAVAPLSAGRGLRRPPVRGAVYPSTGRCGPPSRSPLSGRRSSALPRFTCICMASPRSR